MTSYQENDRRGERRTAITAPLVLWLKLDRPTPAHVVDQSERGTGLVISAGHELSPGTDVEVGLGIRGRRATVMDVKNRGDGRQRLSLSWAADRWKAREATCERLRVIP